MLNYREFLADFRMIPGKIAKGAAKCANSGYVPECRKIAGTAVRCFAVATFVGLLAPAICPLRAAAENTRINFAEMSRQAESAGDIGSATNYLAKARAGAPASLWREYTLKLAALELSLGEWQKSIALLQEYDKAFPESQIDERKIILAEALSISGKYDEARRMLAQLQNKEVSKNILEQLLNAQGMNELRAGKFKESAAFFARLQQISFDPAKEFAAMLRRIYATQRSDNFVESGKLIQQAATKFKNIDRRNDMAKLELFQLLGEKKLPELKKKLTAFMSDAPSADFLLYSFMSQQKLPDKDFDNLAMLRNSFNYAANDMERRAVLRKLSNILLEQDKKTEAAETLEKYLQFFRDAPDRTEVLLQCARLYGGDKVYDKSVQLFNTVISDNSLPLPLRLAASREGAICAAEGKKTAAAKNFLRYIISHSETPARRQEGFFLLGEYEFKLNEFALAAESFENAAAEKGPLAENALYFQMQSQIKLKDYTGAAAICRKLAANAADKTIAGNAAYFNALILQKENKPDEAKAAFAKFAAANPKSEFCSAAAFEAATIAEQMKNYSEAVELYTKYAKQFPGGENAANALFRAMQCAFLIGNDGVVRNLADELTNKYPDSAFTISALFRHVDYLCGESRYPAALAILERIVQMAGKDHPGIVARSLYDQAVIYSKLQNNGRAMELIETVLKKYSSYNIGADAALAGGNILANDGKYDEAALFFRRAIELRKSDGYFVNICRERLADCCLSSNSITKNKEKLAEAITIYTDLSSSEDPSFFVPSLFKLGKALEADGRYRQAVNTFKDLMYRAAMLQKNGVNFDRVWVSKGIYNAALMLLRKDTPAGGAEAKKLLEAAKKFNFSSGEDFDAVISEINRKYRL